MTSTKTKTAKPKPKPEQERANHRKPGEPKLSRPMGARFRKNSKERKTVAKVPQKSNGKYRVRKRGNAG